MFVCMHKTDDSFGVMINAYECNIINEFVLFMR